MYPLRMTRSLAVAAGSRRSRLRPARPRPRWTIVPEKRCYSHGESVNLIGSGFGPSGSASITRDGAVVGSLHTDAFGAFNGVLTLARTAGGGRNLHGHRRDDSSLTASGPDHA